MNMSNATSSVTSSRASHSNTPSLSAAQFSGRGTALGAAALSLLAACHTTKSAEVAAIDRTPHKAVIHNEKPQEAQQLRSLSLPQHPESTRQHYLHITSTDVWDRRSFWYTDRDTILGSVAVDAWDPLKLINTDRPDFTDVAATVGDGRVQLETGFLRTAHRDGQVRSTTETVPNALLRMGVGERFEGRVKWRGYVQSESETSTGPHGSLSGLSDVELGCKVVLADQNNLLPMQSAVVRLGVPVGGSEVSAHTVEPGLSYIYNWQIRRWWFVRGSTGVDAFRQPSVSFDENLQTSHIAHDRYLEVSQSVSSYFQISRQVGSFVEWYMLNRHGAEGSATEHFHDYGLYFYATPNLQFDCRVGWAFGDSFNEAFVGAGVSMRR